MAKTTSKKTKQHKSAATIKEPTLGERAAAVEDPVAAHGSDDEDRPPSPSPPSSPMTQASMVMLLKQALRGEDPALLQRCLAVDDQATIRATVAALSPNHVHALLSFLAPRLSALQPGGRSALSWLHATLTHHAGYIASSPSLQAVLVTMHASVSQRMATLPSLLALNGRLSLVLGSISSTQHQVEGIAGPQVVYEEGDDQEGEDVGEEEGEEDGEPEADDVFMGGDNDAAMFMSDDDDDDMLQ